jgi:hypothetical protein
LVWDRKKEEEGTPRQRGNVCSVVSSLFKYTLEGRELILGDSCLPYKGNFGMGLGMMVKYKLNVFFIRFSILGYKINKY